MYRLKTQKNERFEQFVVCDCIVREDQMKLRCYQSVDTTFYVGSRVPAVFQWERPLLLRLSRVCINGETEPDRLVL